MDDTIYRHASISEENLHPDRHPGRQKLEEWSDALEQEGHFSVPEVTSEKEREERLKELDEVIKADIENISK